MAKKLIRNFLPDPKKIRNNRYLKFLGTGLDNPDLWHLNRRSAALAFFIGIFCALIPIPFQMVIAACIAILVKCNLPLSIALVWLTNPITMPPVFYFTYRIGCYFLGEPIMTDHIEFTFEGLALGFTHIWKPLYLGSIITGFCSGLACYIIIRLSWRCHIVRYWKYRRIYRKRKNA